MGLDKMIFLTLLLIMHNRVANGSPTVSTTTIQTLHFTVQLDQKDWFSQLLNPCNHDSSGDQSSNDVLGVAGREAEVRTITGTTLSRLTSIEKDLLQEATECTQHDLPTLPSLPPSNLTKDTLSEEVLTQVYASALHLAAHFKYMAEDWNDGIRCKNTQDSFNLVNAFNRQGDFFSQLMCTLMAPVNPTAAPKPSEEMKRNIYDPAKETQIYHYQDCIARSVRDCKVYNYAKTFLRLLLNATRA